MLTIDKCSIMCREEEEEAKKGDFAAVTIHARCLQRRKDAVMCSFKLPTVGLAMMTITTIC